MSRSSENCPVCSQATCAYYRMNGENTNTENHGRATTTPSTSNGAVHQQYTAYSPMAARRQQDSSSSQATSQAPQQHLTESALLELQRDLQSSSQGDDDMRSISAWNDANRDRVQGQSPPSNPALTRLSASTASTSEYLSAQSHTETHHDEAHPRQSDPELVHMGRSPSSHSTATLRWGSSSGSDGPGQ